MMAAVRRGFTSANGGASRATIPIVLAPVLVLLSLTGGAARAGDAARSAAELERRGARLERNDRLPGKPVVRVAFDAARRPGVGDEEAALLADLTELRFLDLGDTALSDAGLARLRGLDQPALPRPGRHTHHRRRSGQPQGQEHLERLYL